MKSKGFKKPTYQEWLAKMKLKPTQVLKVWPLKRKKLRIKGISTTTELKDEIQAVLREIVMLRDGGCFLRHFKNRIQPSYYNCGGFRKDGGLILQAEQLHSRSNAISFSDSRLVVCCCYRHHFHYKKQYGTEYDKFAREFIGPVRARLWDSVVADRSPHKVDLKLELLALKNELKKLKEKHENTK